MADTSGKLKRPNKQKADDRNLTELAQIMVVGMGDKEATPDEAAKVKAWLAANPDELLRMDWLSDEAIEKVVECATAWVYEQEAVKGQMRELRTTLGYEGSNMIERMAIDQAVLCWARLYFLEKNLSYHTKNSHTRDGAHYWDRRITMAQGRYNQALISLAKIRKLKLPDITAIQANVAYVNATDGPVGIEAKRLLPAGEGK